ncbi:MAG: Uma2 family endonuclease [Abditibacteriales bacterium]|nr:Uma2 family endonuclease [Abditibacteriales bacterium]MDW8365203.1 Uma2 family endonuclease [Abditibacteriales bacterium]
MRRLLAGMRTMATLMKAAAPQPFRWTREAYYRLARLGLFDGRRVELIEGEILEMSPQLPPHTSAVFLAEETLRTVFREGYVVRTQAPLSLGMDSDPEPDVAVVAGCLRDYTQNHPTSAVLVLEVAEASLALDRGRKARLYAEAGIEDYWIVNLRERQVEVHRRPQKKPRQRRAAYTEVTVYGEKDTVTPLAAPHAKVKVADLLP